MEQSEILERLTKLAFELSIPFCYGCYRSAPQNRCSKCGSNDLMRLVESVVCEWGTDWVVEYIIRENLSPANTSEIFEDSIRDCYTETTQVGWLTLDTLSIIKEQDPVSWNLAESEWLDQEVEEGHLLTFDNGTTYYWTFDIERFLDRTEKEKIAC